MDARTLTKAILENDIGKIKEGVPDAERLSAMCDLLTLEAVNHRASPEVLDYVFKRSRLYGNYRESPEDERLESLFEPSDVGNSTLVTITDEPVPESGGNCRVTAGEDYTSVEYHPPGASNWQLLTTLKRRGQRTLIDVPAGSGLRALQGGSIAVVSGSNPGGDYNFVPCAYAQYAARKLIFFAYRNSGGGAGQANVAAFGQAADVELRNGQGVVVDSATIAPYTSATLFTQEDVEHSIESTAPVSAVVSAQNAVYDIRTVYPPSTRLITHKRFLRVTAVYPGTTIETRSAAGVVATGTASPSTAYEESGGTGYGPSEMIIVQGSAPIAASTSADGSGFGSTSGVPFEYLAQLFPITHQTGRSTANDKSGLTVASPWEGPWRAYSGAGVLVHSGNLVRRNGVTSQEFPATDQWVPGSVNYGLDGGWVELDVPGILIFNGYTDTFGGDDHTDGSEWNMAGTVPSRLKTIFREIGGETYRLRHPSGEIPSEWVRA